MEARTTEGGPIAVRDAELLDAVWSICGADPVRERRIFLTPIAGAVGVMLAVEGSLPKGLLHVDGSTGAVFAFSYGRQAWRRVDQAKKHAAAVRVILSQYCPEPAA